MNAKQRKTLEAIFVRPTRSDIAWADVESLFNALGATISEGKGSRVRISLQEVKAAYHRPHPQREANKSTIDDVRAFLVSVGVTP